MQCTHGSFMLECTTFLVLPVLLHHNAGYTLMYNWKDNDTKMRLLASATKQTFNHRTILKDRGNGDYNQINVKQLMPKK